MTAKWTGTPIVRRMSALVGLVVVLLGAGVGPADAASTPLPTLTVSPQPALAGETIDATGTYNCRALVSSNGGVADAKVGFTLASAVSTKVGDGGFKVSLKAPTKPGAYTLSSWCIWPSQSAQPPVVSAVRQLPEGPVLESTAAVTVVDPLRFTQMSVDPSHAARGTAVVVRATRPPSSCLDEGITPELRVDGKPFADVMWDLTAGTRGITAGLKVPDLMGLGPHQLVVSCPRKGSPAIALPPVTLTVDPSTSPTTATTTSGSSINTRTASTSTPPTPTTTSTTPSSSTSTQRTVTSSSSTTTAPPTLDTGGTGPPTDAGIEEPSKRAALAAWLRPTSDPVLLDVPRLLGFALLAIVLMLLVGFPAQLFESTYEENHDRISSAWRRLPRFSWHLPVVPQPMAFGGFVLLGVLLYGLTDPNFGRDPEQTLLDAAGFAIALPLVTLAFEIPAEAYARRAGRSRSRLRTLPSALVIALGCAALSFAGHFQPGYIYGLIAGYAALATRRLDVRQQARAVIVGAATIAAVCVLAWVAWTPIDTAIAAGGLPAWSRVVDAILATVIVVGVQALAFQLLPMTFMDGHAIDRWNRWWWRGIYSVVLFALIIVTFAPRTRNEGVDAQIVMMVSLFVAFGAASVAFWAYFRFTKSPDMRSN
jgi:hypothetical protein